MRTQSQTTQLLPVTEKNPIVYIKIPFKHIIFVYHDSDQTIEQISQRGWEVSILGNIKNHTRHSPEQTCSSWSCSEQISWTKGSSGLPFHFKNSGSATSFRETSLEVEGSVLFHRTEPHVKQSSRWMLISVPVEGTVRGLMTIVTESDVQMYQIRSLYYILFA